MGVEGDWCWHVDIQRLITAMLLIELRHQSGRTIVHDRLGKQQFEFFCTIRRAANPKDLSVTKHSAK
jgi:hypothetical protein